MNTNAKIKRLREKAGFSQEHVAEFLGVNPKIVAKIENNECLLTSNMVNKLTALFGISVTTLLNEDDPTPALSYANSANLSVDEMHTIAQINKIALNNGFMSSKK